MPPLLPAFLQPRRRSLFDLEGDDPERFRTPDFNPSLPIGPTARTPIAPRIPMSAMPSVAGNAPPARVRAESLAIAPPETLAPRMDLRREGVPIPQLPGRPGEPHAYDPVTAAQYDYVMQGTRDRQGNLGGKVRRSGKDIALAALGGLMRGGVLGAATGGIGATISPEFGREFNFETFHEPRMQREMARAQQQDAMRRQAAIDDLNRRRMETGISADEARIATERARIGMPMEVSPGASVVDPQTGRILATAPNRPAGAISPASPRRYAIGGNLVDEAGNVLFTAPPKPEKERSVRELTREAETTREAEEGSVEQIAEDSYQGRGGDVYVLSKLPAATQRILTEEIVSAPVVLIDPDTGKPAIDASGKPITEVQDRPATPAEVAAAQRQYDAAIRQERAAIRQHTQGAAREKASRRATGRNSSRGGTSHSGATRNVTELSKRYPGIDLTP